MSFYKLFFVFILIYSDVSSGQKRKQAATGSCVQPQPVANAVLRSPFRNKETFNTSEVVEYDCAVGYAITRRSRKRTCNNGRWSKVRFSCDPILCPKLNKVRNGNKLFQDTSGRTRNDYESVTEYTCKRGYYLNGDTEMKVYKRTCQADGTWGGKEPVCDVPRCKQISDFYNGTIRYFGDRKLHSQAFYRCDDAFSLFPKVQISECEDEQKWNPDPPKCYQKCRLSGYPNNTDTFYRIGLRNISADEYIDHGSKIPVECNDGYTPSEQMTTTCKNGEWDHQPLPMCKPNQCSLTLLEGMSFSANSRLLTEESGTKQTFDTGTKLTMQCNKGYTMKDMISQKPVKQKIRYSTCYLGNWTHEYECTPEKCSVPKVSHASLKDKASGQYKHREKITFYCDDGFNFDQNVSTKITRFETTCILGNWTDDIPQECKEDGCRLDIHEGSYYYVANTNESITSVKLIEHNTNIQYQCMDTYDLFNDKNEIYLDKPYKPTAKCYQGKWRNAFFCKKSCTISKDRRYMYEDGEGEKIEPGSIISDATTLNVTCSIIDLDEYLNSYYDDEYSTDLASYSTITCANNTLSQLELDCPEVETCLELQHGNVTMKNGYFMVSCHNGYSLNLTIPEDGMCICKHGTLKSEIGDQIPHCIRVETCFELQHGNVTMKNGYFMVSCDKGYSLNLTMHEDESCICKHGTLKSKIGDQIPHCIPDGCRLDIHEGSYYYVANTNELITSVKLIEHMADIQMQCKDTYDLFNDKNEIYLDKTYKPTVTCYQGKWQNALFCKKSCTLSKDRRYVYEDRSGKKIEPGSKISDDTTLNVTCSIIDLDEYYNSFYDDEYNTDLASYPTITCANNTLSQLELDCPEVETCLELQHGNVTMKNGYFMVSCHKGYSLNLTIPEDGRCICKHGTLQSVYGDQIPHCIPDNCTIPYKFDGRLSVTYRNFVSLSGGSVVAVGEFVYLNCSKSYGPNYEPLNRRFTCSNGLWTEAERDRSWRLGYNGQFPRCRAAICEPNCTNGGVCYKDDTCRCRHLTEGKRCENVICDNKCSVNGGKCVGPGKCGDCPQGKFGKICEQDGCLLPKDAAKYEDSQTVFSPGDSLTTFSCPAGFFLSSRDGMTCQDGNWSNIVKCVEASVYLISVKTGKVRYSGTNANVYITLHGLRGSTDRIYLQGSFEAGNLEETRKPAKDVRPITSVEIGHDGRGIGPDWYLEYVSIYVENMEEYYVFRHNDWVKGKTDIDLPRQGLDQERCIASFDSGLSWYPNLKLIRKKNLRRGTSPRGCKQACINLQIMDCVAVFYNSNRKTCWGFADRVNFKEVQGKLKSVYLRTCKRFN